MKSLNKIILLANQFEQKLQKYAQSGNDEVVIGNQTRTTAEQIIDKFGRAALSKIEKIMFNKAKIALNAEPSTELHGKVTLGGSLVIKANKSSGQWIFDPSCSVGSSVDGDFANDADITNLVAQASSSLLNMIKRALPAQLDRMHATTVDVNVVGMHSVNSEI